MPERFVSDDPNWRPPAGETFVSDDPNWVPPSSTGEKSVGGFLSNVASSGGRFLRDVVTAPVALAQMVGEEPLSGWDVLGPGVRVGKAVAKLAPAMLEGVKQRYGSFDALKETAYTDPVGMLADIVPVGRIGALGRVGKAAARVADPAAAVVRAGRAVTPGQAALQGQARRVMQSAMKPSESLTLANRSVDLPAVAAREGIVVSRGGQRALAGELGTLRDQAQTLRQAATQRGATVSPTKAVKPALGMIRDLRRTSATPTAPVREAGAVTKDFLTHPIHSTPRMVSQTTQVPTGVLDPSGQMITRAQTTQVARGRTPTPIPVADAIRMKERLGAEVRRATSPLSPPPTGGTQAKDALRRGLRQEIEKAVPGLAEVNARRAELIPVAKQLQRSVRTADNTNVLSMRRALPILAGSSGAYVTGSPVAGAAVTAAGLILDSPAAKSRIAHQLWKAGEKAPTVGEAMSTMAPLATALSATTRLTGEAPTSKVEQALADPSRLASAAQSLQESEQRLGPVADTIDTPGGKALADTVLERTPSGDEARNRSRNVRAAMEARLETPEFEALPFNAQVAQLAQTRDDASRLVGGVAGRTWQKTLERDLMLDYLAPRTTERP